MTKIEATASNKKQDSTECEQQLATDLELISLLRENPSILERHPELLAVLEVPHQTGSAVSLIERQIAVLRKQSETQNERMRELMDVARDNMRLTESRHQHRATRPDRIGVLPFHLVKANCRFGPALPFQHIHSVVVELLNGGLYIFKNRIIARAGNKEQELGNMQQAICNNRLGLGNMQA